MQDIKLTHYGVAQISVSGDGTATARFFSFLTCFFKYKKFLNVKFCKKKKLPTFSKQKSHIKTSLKPLLFVKDHLKLFDYCLLAKKEIDIVMSSVRLSVRYFSAGIAPS
jgi:hypothetical protein